MAKWYLFWILTVQSPSGELTELPRMQVLVDSQLDCMMELEVKKDKLDVMLGGNVYTTHYFDGPVRLSGTLVGVAVGCDNG